MEEDDRQAKNEAERKESGVALEGFTNAPVLPFVFANF